MSGPPEPLATATIATMLPLWMEEQGAAGQRLQHHEQHGKETPHKEYLPEVDPAATLLSVAAASDLTATGAVASAGAASHSGTPAGGASASLAMSPAAAFAAATAVCRRLDSAAWWWCSCYAVPAPGPRPTHTTARAYYLDYDDAMRERLAQRLRPPYALACVRAPGAVDLGSDAPVTEEASLESLQLQATEPPREVETTKEPAGAALEAPLPPAAHACEAPFIREVPVPAAQLQHHMDDLRASLAALEAQHAAQMMASCSATTDAVAGGVMPCVPTLGQSATGSTTDVPAGAGRRVSGTAPIDAGVTRGYTSSDAAQGSQPCSDDVPSEAVWNGVSLSTETPQGALATPLEVAVGRPATSLAGQRPFPHDHDGPLPPPLSVLQASTPTAASGTSGTGKSGERALLSPVSVTYADALHAANRHGFVEGAGGRPITSVADRGVRAVPSALSSSDRSAEVVTASQSPAWGLDGAIALPGGEASARMLDGYMWNVRTVPPVSFTAGLRVSPAPASGDPSRCSTAATGAGEGSLMMASAVSAPRPSLAASTTLGHAGCASTLRDAEEEEEEVGEGEEAEAASVGAGEADTAQEPRDGSTGVPEGMSSHVTDVLAAAPACDAEVGAACERDDSSSRLATAVASESTVASLLQDHSRATQPPGPSSSSERSSPERARRVAEGEAAVWVAFPPLVPSHAGDGDNGVAARRLPQFRQSSTEAQGPLGTVHTALPELEHTVEGSTEADGDAAPAVADVSVDASSIAKTEDEATFQSEAYSSGGALATAAAAADAPSSPWFSRIAPATAAAGEGGVAPVVEGRRQSNITGRQRRSLSCDAVTVPEPHAHIYSKLNADLLVHSRNRGNATIHCGSSATGSIGDRRLDEYAPSSTRSLASSCAYTPHPYHLPRPAAPSPVFTPLMHRSPSAISVSSPAAPSSPLSQRGAAARAKAAAARGGSFYKGGGSASGAAAGSAAAPADANVDVMVADAVFNVSRASSSRQLRSSSPLPVTPIPAPPGRPAPAIPTLTATSPWKETEPLPAPAGAAAAEDSAAKAAAPMAAGVEPPSVALPPLTRPPPVLQAATRRAQSAGPGAFSVMPPVRRPSSSSRGYAGTSMLTTGRLHSAAARADDAGMPLLRPGGYGGPSHLLRSPEASLTGLPVRPALSRASHPIGPDARTPTPAAERST